MSLYLGIDPGLSGGIALLSDGCAPLYWKMPATDRDLFDLLEPLEVRNALTDTVHCILERVSASPQMGVTSAWTFGRGYGKIEMALCAARIPFDYVQPAKWQQVMGCRTKGDKNISKARAQQVFPDLPIRHWNADALLIAEFCRRLHTRIPEKESA